MALQEINNIQESKRNAGYILFYIFYLLLLFSILFLQLFSHRTLPGAVKELIAFLCVIILPLLFPRLKLSYKLIISGILFIIFTGLGYTTANHPDLELAALFYIPYP